MTTVPARTYRSQDFVLLFLAFFLAGIIFIIDYNVPNTLALGAMYCIVILYSWLLPGKKSSVAVAVVCSILAVLGSALSDAGPADQYVNLNVVISLVVIWTCASLVTLAKYSFRELELSRDSLEQKVLERTRELEQSEYRFRHMIKEVQDYAIILLDEFGNIVHWNRGAEQIQGYMEPEIIGENFIAFFNQLDQKEGKPDKLLKLSLDSGSALEEGWLIKKDGTSFWAVISVTPLKKDKVLTGYSIVVRDLSERKQAELVQAEYIKNLDLKNRELEQFAYVAAHDLQEPLNTLIMFTDLLAEEVKIDPKGDGEKFLNFITQAAQRMKALVRGLLDYSRIGNQKELTRVDFNRILQEVQEDLHNSISETKALIDIPGPLPTTYAMETEIRLLFQNLISNALKFRKEGDVPKIRITAEEDKDYVNFSIEDNGIGIPEKYQDKIFVIFKRLHNKDAVEGTGIGLAHCHKIVGLHQGSIGVHSKEGEGSTFYFNIKKQTV